MDIKHTIELISSAFELAGVIVLDVHAYFTQECPALCHDLESLRWLTFGGELEDVLSFRTD